MLFDYDDTKWLTKYIWEFMWCQDRIVKYRVFQIHDQIPETMPDVGLWEMNNAHHPIMYEV